MNVSGPSIVKCLTQSKAEPSKSLLVIHDSLPTAALKVSPKNGGSANGHNGVKSAIEAVRTTSFHRLRIGIGAHAGDAAGYVLGKLSAEELEWWGPEGQGLELVIKEIEAYTAKTTPSRG